MHQGARRYCKGYRVSKAFTDAVQSRIRLAGARHLQAISPGISASASSISRRPKSAWVMSFTLYCRHPQRDIRRGARLASVHNQYLSGSPLEILLLLPACHKSTDANTEALKTYCRYLHGSIHRQMPT